MITARNVDLSNCDREQIQYPAATLAHGFLVVLAEPELSVVQAGQNAAEYLGLALEKILGKPIALWLDATVVRAMRSHLQHTVAAGPPLYVETATINTRQFDLLVHRCGSNVIAEFEARTSRPPTFAGSLFSRVHVAIAKLQQTRSVQQFLDLAVSEIRDLTGFDRVMAYQFQEDGSGAVLAESVTGGWESFLGLHYPASDIPQPARRLFKLTWLRHQPDISYTPVPIVPASNAFTGQPLDLSYALLRSVSVMYSQYLKNMGTHSSMVMTLLKDGELWGLIACHHHSGPRHVPFEIRAACEFLAHMVSLLLAAKEEQEDFEYRARMQTTQSRMVGILALTDDFVNVLIDRKPNLLDFIDCGGAAVVLQGKPTLTGATPEAEEVAQLVEWLSHQEENIFFTDCLSKLHPAALRYCGVASGMLAIRTGASKNDYILLFRPEYRRTVNWAGDPKKPVDISDDGQRLMPRTSFAIWQETVRLKSRPWKAVELSAARDLRDALVEIDARRADQFRVLYQNLQRTNVELDAFAYVASHDLKEPLRGIHNYSQFLLEDTAGILPSEAANKLETVIRLTRRMDDLLDSLLHYARLGRDGMDLVPCDVQQLVAEVIDTLATRIQEAGVQVRVLGTLPTIEADYTRLGEVFQNLIVNAIKYNDKDMRFVEIGSTETDGERVFFVHDNGIGIAAEHHENIFAIFRRLHPQDKFGGGTGAGLTIVRKILDRHEGRIWVESTPGEGTTFFFTIGTAK